MAAYIYLKSIAKKNRNESIIADLSLGLEKGLRLSLVGENNSGKTMLLKILAGIINVDFGVIFIDGKEFSSRNINIRNKICYIPEQIDFDYRLSVYENLSLYIKLYKSISTKKTDTLIVHWANIFSFSNLIHSKVSEIELSKLKIIQLSRLFMHEPEILILDEPTKVLDPNNQILFWDIIKTKLKKTTIVFASQNFDEIQAHSDRVSFLDNGKIRLNGSISEIMNQTKGYGYYKILFKHPVDNEFEKKMKENQDCYHLNIKDTIVEFYSPNKNSILSLIKEAFKYDIIDFIERPFSFKDVFLTQTKK